MRTNPMEVVDHQQYLFSEVTSLTNSINMNSLIVFCVLSLAALTIARPDGATYTDKYDNVDLDEILGNRRLMVPYIKCMLDQGKCAPDAKELKEHIKEALENECGKCTEAQKKGTRRVIGHLINHEADFWNELTAKYDPERKYTTKYEKELKEVKA
nr:allergen Tha p 1 isoform X1 [Helicoverpa armigera]